MTYPQLSLYIDGEFIHGGGRKEQDILNPATNEVIGKLPHATKEDLDRALAAAARAFESWKKTSPMERSKVLRRVAELARIRLDDATVADVTRRIRDILAMIAQLSVTKPGKYCAMVRIISKASRA